MAGSELTSSEYKQFLRRYYDVQTQVYEDAAKGWVYWTWKAEASAEWSYQAGLSGGWIPYNPEEHTVSRAQICQ
jgi:glucan 1,3-beta-glucosidase